MNGWFLIVWGAIMLVVGLGQCALTASKWQPSGYAASTHDDPSLGPNGLF